MLRKILLVTVIVAVLLAVYVSQPAARTLDAEPVLKTSERILPRGQAEFAFDLNTSGDQMSLRRRQTGLVFVVQYGDTIEQQQFASCTDVGFGGAAGEFPEAMCDERHFRFLVDPEKSGSVHLQEEKGDEWESLLHVILPLGTESIKYNPELHMIHD